MVPLCDMNTTADSLPSLRSFGSTDSSEDICAARTTGQCQACEIALDPEVLSSLCRRGRRHLRAIQSSCQVQLRLDRVRGVLHAVGSPEAIQNAQNRLESLGGPSKEVSLAVWTELMRTRTAQEGPEAHLTQMQESSGCRIHIDRQKQEVRLFGPCDTVALADKLLDEFSIRVVESIVPVGNCMPSSAVLENFALKKHVTMQPNGDRIIITGMHQRVQEAEAEITNHINAHAAATALCRNTPAPRMPEASNNKMTGTAPSHSQTGVVQDHVQAWTYPVNASMPAVSQQTSVGQHKLSSSMHVPRQEDSHLCEACPTCAAVRTCASCGNWCGFPADRAGSATGVQPTTDGNMPTYQYVQFVPYEALTAASGYTNMGLIPVMQHPGHMVPAGMTQMVVQAPYMQAGKMPACFIPIAGNNHEFGGNAVS